jgi:hypothetical protein
VRRGLFAALLFVLLLAVDLWTLAPTLGIAAPILAVVVYAPSHTTECEPNGG